MIEMTGIELELWQLFFGWTIGFLSSICLALAAKITLILINRRSKKK